MTPGWIIFAIIIVIAISLLIVGIIDGNRYVMVENTFYLPKLEKDLKFVMISDLHDKVYGKYNEKVLDDIDQINPDFIIFAGDLITSHANENYKPGLDFIDKLSQKYTIYFGMGNHETRIKVDTDYLPGKYEEFINGVEGKVILLDNKTAFLEEYNLDISGLELSRDYFKRFKKLYLDPKVVYQSLGNRNNEHASILIAHNPAYFDSYAEWNPDLVLSGHVHGGIMVLPFLGGVMAPSFTLFPKYDGGIFKKDKSTILIGRGLGTHSIPLRFFNPAELHVVNCLKES